MLTKHEQVLLHLRIGIFLEKREEMMQSVRLYEHIL